MMANLINIRRSWLTTWTFFGGDSQNSKQIDAIMGNIGKFVSVKLVVKFEGERKFVNVQELKIAE